MTAQKPRRLFTDEVGINRKDLDTLLICAVRYAIGRRTYIVGDVAALVEQHAGTHAVDIISRDLREAFKDYAPKKLGDDCDDAVWRRLLEKLTASQP